MAPTIKVHLVGDTSKLQSAFREAESAADKVSRRMQSAGKAMTLGLTLPLAAAGVASIKAASDLQEAQNKSTVVFGRWSKDVGRFADSSAKGFGLSERAALSATGAFGNLFTALGMGQRDASKMSVQLAKLGADLASFHNIGTEDALEKLRSGLVGEIEPLRALGVSFNEAQVKAKAMQLGLADASGELSESAKVQARYALIMEQTSSAQGDFARTADSVANQTRSIQAQIEDLAASFGEKLLPQTGMALGALEGLIGFVGALPDPLVSAGIAAGGFAAALGPLMWGTGKLVDVYKNSLLPALGTIRESFGDAEKRATMFGTAIKAVGVTAGIVALSAALDHVADANRKAAQYAGDLADKSVGSISTYNDFAKAIERVATAQERETEARDRSAHVPILPGVQIGSEAARRHEKALEDLGAEYGELSEQQANVHKLFVDLGQEWGVTTVQVSQLASTLGVDLRGSIDSIEGELRDHVGQWDTADAAFANAKNELAEVATQFDDTKVAVENLQRALETSLDPFVRADEAWLSFSDSLGSLIGLIDTGTASTDEIRRAVNDSTTAFMGHLEATAQVEHGTEQLIGIKQHYLEQLQALIDKTNGPTRDALIRHKERIEAIPDEALTSVNVVDNASGTLKTIATRISDMAGQIGVSWVQRWMTDYTKNLATGGVMRAGTGGGRVNSITAIVGEEAPRWPEYVIPTNPQHRRRALDLMSQASGDLGVAGLAAGGVVGAWEERGNWVRDEAVRRYERLASELARSGGRGGKAVQFALAQVGKPYVWGATGPGAYDCSGLTSAAWRAAGVSIPRVSHSQIAAARGLSHADALRTAGALLYRPSAASPSGGHIFLSTGDGGSVNAKGRAYGVVRERPASSFTRGGLPVFDSGGVLAPGANLVMNRTGRPEALPAVTIQQVTINATGKADGRRLARDFIDGVHEGLREKRRRVGTLGLT